MDDISPKKMKKRVKIFGISLFVLVVFMLSFCNAVTAHPGHDHPEEVIVDVEPSDSQINDPGSKSISSDTGPSYGVSTSQSGITTERTQFTSNEALDQESNGNDNATTTPEYPKDTIGSSMSSSTSIGGITPIIGLTVVVGLIAISFPYKKDSTLSKFKMLLFNR